MTFRQAGQVEKGEIGTGLVLIQKNFISDLVNTAVNQTNLFSIQHK
jgi:hypothetical protein